jgi:hypothetical protein
MIASSLLVLAAAALPSVSAQPVLAEDCEFLLGFKDLHDLIPSVVGDCIEDETHNPENGDALQRTTGGLLVWRKADNWTAFTNGATTWLNGPNGLQSRSNSDRFPWEAAAPASSSGTPSAPAAAPSPPPPPPPPAATSQPAFIRNPSDFVLKTEELGDKIKLQGKPKTGTDSNGNNWTELAWKRDSDPKVSRSGPEWVVNRVYVGKTEDEARRIFNEQNVRDMPEAKALNLSFGSLGDQGMPQSPGDEARALGACNNCNDADPIRHYRIVFRRDSVVEVLYTYGRDSGNYFGVPMSFVLILDNRITAPVAGPLPEIITHQEPIQVALGLGDNRTQANVVFERSGYDGGAKWYEIRVERDEELMNAKLGPTHMYNRVWVADTIDIAKQIYRDNAVMALPESTRQMGPPFEEKKIQRVGNESYGIGACNDDCSGANSDKLHERVVFRWGNMVSLIYTWGREDQSNPDVITDLAKRVIGRVQP